MAGPFLAVLVGCIEFGLDPVDTDVPPVRAVVVDAFDQAPAAPVDVLFVVDDTASMAHEQSVLAASFGPLADSFDASHVAWQVGVVRGNGARSDVGVLVGQPWVLAPDAPGAARQLADRLRVGTDGLPPEGGLYAATRALELAVSGGPNAGFRRPGAALDVVFVSDEDNHSDGWLGPDPIAAFLAVFAESGAGGPSARAFAVIGPMPSGCTTSTGEARPGARYAEIAEQTGGFVQSICADRFTDLADRLLDQAAEPAARFPLSQDPIDGTIRVDVDGLRWIDGWSFQRDGGAAVVFTDPPAVGARIAISYVVEVSG